MTDAHFVTLVLLDGQKRASEEVLRLVADQFVHNGYTDGKDLAKCILAAELVETQKGNVDYARSSKAGAEPESNRVHVEARRANQVTAEALAPWVEQVRKNMFGRVRAPFSTYKKAVKWIEEAAKPGEGQPDRSIILTYAGLRKGRRNVPGVIAGVENVYVACDTPLGHLGEATNNMSVATGCSRELLVAHILTKGMPIAVPTFGLRHRWLSTRLPSGKSFQRLSVMIDVLIPRAFSGSTLRRCELAIKRMVNPSGGRALRERDLALLRLVDADGGLPMSTGSGEKTRFGNRCSKNGMHVYRPAVQNSRTGTAR